MASFFVLSDNFILIHTRDEYDTGFFEVNLAGTVDITDGEDLAVKLSCLPVHSACVIDLIYQTLKPLFM